MAPGGRHIRRSYGSVSETTDNKGVGWSSFFLCCFSRYPCMKLKFRNAEGAFERNN